jgi:hypothetical protein
MTVTDAPDAAVHGDRALTVTALTGDWVVAASRLAVLKPALGLHGDQSDAALLQGYPRLRGIWRDRLVELQRAAWGPAQDPLRLQYMRNCPPFGAEPCHGVVPCQKVRVCPFCHMRLAVADPIRRLSSYIAGLRGLRLVSFETVWEFPVGKGCLEAAVDTLKGGRTRELDCLAYQAAFVVSHVRLDDKVWLTRRGIAVCPVGDPPEIRGAKVWTAAANDEGLAHLGVPTFSYQPDRLYDPPGAVVVLLNALEGVRTLTGYGGLASGAARDWGKNVHPADPPRRGHRRRTTT